jgi:hypothetical protein
MYKISVNNFKYLIFKYLGYFPPYSQKLHYIKPITKFGSLTNLAVQKFVSTLCWQLCKVFFNMDPKPADSFVRSEAGCKISQTDNANSRPHQDVRLQGSILQKKSVIGPKTFWINFHPQILDSYKLM